VKRRPAGAPVTRPAELNHTSGVPFVASGRHMWVSAPSTRSERVALVRIQVPARGSVVLPFDGACLGRPSAKGVHTRGCFGQTPPRHYAGPAACVLLHPPVADAKGSPHSPGPTIVAGRNTQPRGLLSKVRSREHVCLIGPCANIEPATQSPGCQMRSLNSWRPGHNPGSTSYGRSIATRQAGPALLILPMRGGAAGGAPRPTEGCWMCRLNLQHRVPDQCDVREER